MRGEHDLISIIIPTKNERENITKLIESIYAQIYRPIEVIVVDGGSTDGTLELIQEAIKRYSSNDFRIVLLKEEDFGPIRSPANARNIGIMNSRGKYIAFFDADMILLDRDLLEEAVKALKVYPWVGVKAIPIIDTLIEEALIAEAFLWGKGEYVHRYCCFQRSLFNERLFDPYLGFGEDQDFFEYYLRKKRNITPIIIDKYIGRHEPHTVKELLKQSVWYASTLPLFAKKHMTTWQLIRFITHTNTPAVSGTFTLAIAFILAHYGYIGIMMALTIITLHIVRRILKVYTKLPKLNSSKIKVFMVLNMVEYILRPLGYLYGLLKYVIIKKHSSRY